jgi:hypothetical protein
MAISSRKAMELVVNTLLWVGMQANADAVVPGEKSIAITGGGSRACQDSRGCSYSCRKGGVNRSESLRSAVSIPRDQQTL